MLENQRLKTLRESQNYSVVRFAQLIGVPQATYYRIEQGKAKLTMEAAAAVIRLFNVDMNWLMNGEGGEGPVFQEEVVTKRRYEELEQRYLKLQEQLIDYQQTEIRKLKNGEESSPEADR
jgi:transcriptional regulator with XRE-family HTH domain